MSINPEITEADLRNAALVLEYAGHARAEFMNGQSGTVCADGALKLATYNRIYVERPNLLALDAIYDDLYEEQLGEYHSGLLERYRAARDALVDLLPERCTREDHQETDPFSGEPFWTCQGDRFTGVLVDSERIHHYNDWECQGGDEAADLFIQAAEKVRANA